MAAGISAKSVKQDKVKMFQATESCSVCLDLVSDTGERSIAKLKCGHHFHLDCIGSAFNAKGAMQCPNCRHVEDGQWLYANGSRWNEDISIEEVSYEDDYEVYQAMPDLVAAHEEFHWNHLQWCPYQHMGTHVGGSAYPQFQVSLGEVDGPGGFHEVVVNVLYNSNESGGATSSAPACPHLAAQGLRQSRHSQIPEDSHTRPSISHGLDSLDPLGRPSAGTMMSDGALNTSERGLFSWGHRSSLSGYSEIHSPIMSESTLFASEMDRTWSRGSPSFLSALYNDPGMLGVSAHERHRSWARSENARTSSLGSQSPGSYGYSGLHQRPVDFGTPPASHSPCPRPDYLHAQAGTSQVQPETSSSFLRNGSSASIRRPRHTRSYAHSIPAGRQVPASPGEQSRRLGVPWNGNTAGLGQEPTPAPGLEGQGWSSEGQGLGWRREATPEPMVSTVASEYSPESQWRALMRSVASSSAQGMASDLPPGLNRRGEFSSGVDGQGGSSRMPTDGQFGSHRSSYPYMGFGSSLSREGQTEVGSLSTHNFLRTQR